jgi:hypothetical protein
MPVSRYYGLSRFTTAACLLSLLLVLHLSLRYLFGTLFGFVKYRGLAPVAPFVVLVLCTVLLVGVAGLTAVRRGVAGLALGAGLSVLAVEPFISSFVWGDGCEVSGTAQASLLPEIVGSGTRLVLQPWNGSCSVTLTLPVIGLSTVFLGIGFWRGHLPEAALSRWMSSLEMHWPW